MRSYSNILNDSASILDAVRTLQESEVKTCFVLSHEEVVLGTITDGDIRRGILKGLNLSESVVNVMNSKFKSIQEKVSVEEMEMLKATSNLVVPIVNSKGQLKEILFSRDYDDSIEEIPNSVFILAGGLGKRLGDLTKETPKPMLKVGGKPILKIILEGLKRHGFRKAYISVNFKSHIIENFFKDGADFGIEIEYIKEEIPMGTAGSLSLLENKVEEPLLIINGDILTNVDYGALLSFYSENKTEALVCSREYDVQIPFGVLECDGEEVISIREKPKKRFMVNAGIYLVSPSCLELINKNEVLNMPSFLERIIDSKMKVTTFPISEYWLDIGRLDDFKKANKEVESVIPQSKK